MKENIAVVGMVKRINNEVAEKLALMLDMNYLDMDDLIKYDMSMPISKIVEDNDEEFFLQLESKKLIYASSFYNSIIAVAPTVLLTAANIKNINSKCYTVFLKTSSKQGAKQQEKDFEDDASLYLRYYLHENYSIMARNNGLFASRYADIAVNIDNLSIDEIVDEIAARLANI